jgi:glyoxylate/hydroxypyruvate reductase A
MSVLYVGEPERGRDWARMFAERAPDLGFRTWPDMGDPRDVRFLVAWQPPDGLIPKLPNLEVIFSVGAGVDHLDLKSIPESLPIVRMIDPGLTDGMVEYVVFAVLALHRNLLDYIQDQRESRWAAIKTTLAPKRRVGVMGLGELGRACLTGLKSLGFPLYGWSRTLHRLDGVTCFAGDAQLTEFLGHCDILVCLLPLTAQTRGILSKSIFDRLPRGAGLVNVGRGAHLNERDLLDALEDGRVSGAILDVLNSEPPDRDHTFWHHPRILITPHIASMTHPETAGLVLLDNIRRHQRGEQMHGVVRRALGY